MSPPPISREKLVRSPNTAIREIRRKGNYKIETEAQLDGIYVIRTSVQAAVLNERETVKAYKSLSQVEQAFRCYKTIDLKVRPIYHRLATRVKAHVFLCLLAPGCGMAYAPALSALVVRG